MERLTGVVMEKTGRQVVLMTPQGEFKRVRIKGRIPDIGEEIRVPVARHKFFNMPKARWLAVAAAVILLVVASPLLTVLNQPPETAVAYVSIDINPSIDLTVSNRLNVLDAASFNKDGTLLLKGLDLKGLKYVEAVSLIEKRAEDLGFIHKSNDDTVVVSVTFVPNADINQTSVRKTLLASADSIFADHQIKVAGIDVPAKLRDAARKKGMSPGKYAVLIEAVDAGIPVTEKDMQEKPIVVAIASAGGEPEQIIGKAGEESRFDLKEQKYLDNVSQTGHQTVAANDENVEPAPVSIATSVYNKPGKKRKYVDSIRQDGGPEEPRGNNSTAATGITAPGITGAPAAAPATGTIDNNNPTGADNTPTENTANDNSDLKTDENYMGLDGSADAPDNDEMYKLRPNF